MRAPYWQTVSESRIEMDESENKLVPMFEIEIVNLSKRFGRLAAVDDLTLNIPKGTIFGFLGPNGAGKSTTVKMLTGILRPTSGDARICGLSIGDSPVEVKQKIGVLPEDLALFDHLTIREHGGKEKGQILKALS